MVTPECCSVSEEVPSMGYSAPFDSMGFTPVAMQPVPPLEAGGDLDVSCAATTIVRTPAGKPTALPDAAHVATSVHNSGGNSWGSSLAFC